MAEFCKAKITWGGKEVKVYESSEPGESAELIDDTNLNSDTKEYVASDLHDSDEFTMQVPESDAANFVVGDKKGNLALKRGDRLIREITLKKSGGGVGEVVGNS